MSHHLFRCNCVYFRIEEEVSGRQMVEIVGNRMPFSQFVVVDYEGKDVFYGFVLFEEFQGLYGSNVGNLGSVIASA